MRRAKIILIVLLLKVKGFTPPIPKLSQANHGHSHSRPAKRLTGQNPDSNEGKNGSESGRNQNSGSANYSLNPSLKTRPQIMNYKFVGSPFKTKKKKVLKEVRQ